MQELSFSIENKSAKILVPIDFAREWAVTSEKSSVKGSVTFCFFMPVLLAICMIFLGVLMDSIKWYDVLIALIISLIVFHPMAIKSFGFFRKIIIIITMGFCIYFCINVNISYVVLIFLSLLTLSFWELSYYISIQEIKKVILSDFDLLKLLWENQTLAIKFTDGTVFFKGMSFDSSSVHTIPIHYPHFIGTNI
jgi:hypothetical protein